MSANNKQTLFHVRTQAQQERVKKIIPNRRKTTIKQRNKIKRRQNTLNRTESSTLLFVCGVAAVSHTNLKKLKKKLQKR